jgi:recombinational DNA repair protein RecR
MPKFYVLNCPLCFAFIKGRFAEICLESRRINYAIYIKEGFGLAHNGPA